MHETEDNTRTDHLWPSFLSLAEMQEEHGKLLQRRRKDGEISVQFQKEVEDFIRRGRETGALLEKDDDRWASQNLLDYWASALYSATGQEPPEATLLEFYLPTLINTADRFYKALNPTEQTVARRLFLRLLQEPDNQHFTVKRVLRTRLYPAMGNPAPTIEVLNKLIRAGLLRETQEETQPNTYLEVAHPALVSCWPEFVSWRENNLKQITAQFRLTEAAERWETLKRNWRALFQLPLFKWLLFKGILQLESLNSLEKEFVRSQQKFFLGLICGFSILIFAGLAGRVQLKQNSSRVEAARARSQLSDRLDNAMALSLEAYGTSATTEARSALLTSLTYSPYLTGFLQDPAIKVRSVTFGDNGKLLATGCDDGAIMLWDLDTHQPPRRLTFSPPATLAILSVAFDKDSKLLAAGNADKRIYLWKRDEQETFQPEGVPLEGHAGKVISLTFSANGSLLASGSDDGNIRIWATDTGKQQQTLTLPGDHPGQVLSLAFTQQHLASGGEDGTVLLWDVAKANGAQPAPLATDYKGPVITLAFDKESNLLASGGADGIIGLWDLNAHTLEGIRLYGHNASVTTLTFIRDTKTGTLWLVSGSMDNALIKGDVNKWQELARDLASAKLHFDIIRQDFGLERIFPTTPFSGRVSPAMSVVLSSDGKKLASRMAEGGIWLWDVDKPTLLGSFIDSDPTKADVTSVAVSHDGKLLASGSSQGEGENKTPPPEGVILVWDRVHRELVNEIPTGTPGAVYALAFSRDDATLASVTCTRQSQWYSCSILRPLSTSGAISGPTSLPTALDIGPVSSFAFSADGQTLATGAKEKDSNEAIVTLWDVNKLERRQVLHSGDNNAIITSLAFSLPYGSILAVGDDKAEIGLWHSADGQQYEPLIKKPFSTGQKKITSLAWSRDRHQLASGGEDRSIKLWKFGIKLWKFTLWPTRFIPKQWTASFSDQASPVTSLAFNEDGSILASGSYDKTIVLWDVDTGQRLGRPLSGHTNAITSLTFTPKGKTLVSGSADKRIMLWEVGDEAWKKLACNLVGPQFSSAALNQTAQQDEEKETRAAVAEICRPKQRQGLWGKLSRFFATREP